MNIRKALRSVLNFTLFKTLNYSGKDLKIEPSSLKRVLIVRVNYRIGNIIFLTPLIRALQKEISDAKIDIALGAPVTVSIVKGMPNIQNVYTLSKDIVKNPIKFFKKIEEINSNSYDLVILPVSGSVSSNIVTLLVKSNLKLGFYRKNTWMPINIGVKYPEDISHEALKPLILMDVFNKNREKEYSKYLDIALSDGEIEEGKLMVDSILDKRGRVIVGIFRDARGDKKIDDNWWRELLNRLSNIDRDLVFLDILAPDQKKLSDIDIKFITKRDLRELAKLFSALDVFISADTGPMHLSSASKTPTIALFNVSSPTQYGPIGMGDLSIVVKDKAIELVAKEILEHIYSTVKRDR